MMKVATQKKALPRVLQQPVVMLRAVDYLTQKLRQFIRVVIAIVFYYAGFYRIWRCWKFRDRTSVCVLGLHRILQAGTETASHPALIVNRETFEALLEFLRANFAPLTLEEFVSGNIPGSGKPPCLITFDDGWMDNYYVAWPLLRQRRLPAVIFVSTGYINSGKMFWVERYRAANSGDHRLDELVERYKRMPSAEREELLRTQVVADEEVPKADALLDWSHVREMAKDGIEFGSHTHTHPLLSYEQPAVIEEELRFPRELLNQQIGKEPRAFAYPNGDWNILIRDAVKAAGYSCAFSTEPCWYTKQMNKFSIPRILLHEGNVTGMTGKFSPAVLSLALAGWA